MNQNLTLCIDAMDSGFMSLFAVETNIGFVLNAAET